MQVVKNNARESMNGLDNRLFAYAVAAAAMGASQAGGAIVFTPGPFHLDINTLGGGGPGGGGAFPIDFNQDSVPEFFLHTHSTYISGYGNQANALFLSAGPGANNQRHVATTSTTFLATYTYPAALARSSFVPQFGSYGSGFMEPTNDHETLVSYTYFGSTYGEFAGNPGVEQFLGVTFAFTSGPNAGDGEHAGWIGLEIHPATFSATVTGYAYETRPFTAIHIDDRDNRAIPEPATFGLGVLALGAVGVSAARRRNSGQ